MGHEAFDELRWVLFAQVDRQVACPLRHVTGIHVGSVHPVEDDLGVATSGFAEGDVAGGGVSGGVGDVAGGVGRAPVDAAEVAVGVAVGSGSLVSVGTEVTVGAGVIVNVAVEVGVAVGFGTMRPGMVSRRAPLDPTR